MVLAVAVIKIYIPVLGEMTSIDTDIGGVIIRRSEYSHADGSIKYHKSLYLHSNGDVCMFLSSTPPHTSTCTEYRVPQKTNEGHVL